MSYKPNDAYYGEFTTSRFDTGAAVNADSLPVATATRNGTDDPTFSLTVANIDTGRYKVTGTIPGGYAKGDTVQISIAATVNSVAGKGVIDSFVLDSKRVGDLNDAVAAPTAAAIRTEMDTNSVKLANLDATVSSRSTYAGGDTSGTTTLLARLTAQRATNLDNLDAAITSRQATLTLPANFALLSIDASGRVDTGKWLGTAVTNDANGYPNVNARDWGGTQVTGGLPNTTAPDNASISAIGTIVTSVKVVTDKLGTTVELDGAGPSYQFTAAAMDQAPTGGGGGGLSLLQLQGELDARHVDTTHLDRLDAAVTTRLADGAVTLTAQERQDVANALLDLTDGIESGETLRQAVRFIRGMVVGVTAWNPNTGTLILYRKDGTTEAGRLVLDGVGARTSSTPGTL